ncbi:hypothetical protein HK097_006233 [Rhizophlyctis rosea]|uniref:Uncharacterized protein n=1 Tax=Rhizophlyctis rosea TaxID=64517 RepID=A0AAD5SEZ8_9FUNG|nr:hypothetical protein HK097_006233 [Rhizophlyctis rosea]
MRRHQRFCLLLLLVAAYLGIAFGQATSPSVPTSTSVLPPSTTTTAVLTTNPPTSSSVGVPSSASLSPTTTNAPTTSEPTSSIRTTAAPTNDQQTASRITHTISITTNSPSPSPTSNTTIGAGGSRTITQTPIIIAAVVCGVIGLGLLIFCLTVAVNRGWCFRSRTDAKDLMLDFNNPDTHANWRHSRTINNGPVDANGYLVDDDGGAVVRKHSHNLYGTGGGDVMRKPSYMAYPQPYGAAPSEGQITLPKIGTLPPQVSNTFARTSNFGEYNWGTNNRTSMMYSRDSMVGGLQYHTAPVPPAPAAYSNYPYPPQQLYPVPEYPMQNVPLDDGPYGSDMNSAVSANTVPEDSMQTVREQSNRPNV